MNTPFNVAFAVAVCFIFLSMVLACCVDHIAIGNAKRRD